MLVGSISLMHDTHACKRGGLLVGSLPLYQCSPIKARVGEDGHADPGP